MTIFRKSIFWIHLASGLVAGIVIAIMSATGIAIAFEEEILAWTDREISIIEVPVEGTPKLSIAKLRQVVAAQYPDYHPTMVVVHRDPAQAYTFFERWHDPLYANPFTGETKETLNGQIQDIIHVLEAIHRWLGMQDDLYPTGRLITGICNLVLVVLCATGIYLWWPKVMRWSVWKRAIWFAESKTSRARDFNWHNVIGIWSLPVLTVLAVTAVTISFAWGHALVFQIFGEEAPESRNYGMMAVPPPVVPTPAVGTDRVSFETLIDNVKTTYPDWQSIELQFPVQEDSINSHTTPIAPAKLGLILADYMPSRAYVPIESDPFTGEILQAVHFEERSAGLQARIWIRFLHTGAGLGLPGKIIASLASFASLFLVYTGFALAWRRFFPRTSG